MVQNLDDTEATMQALTNHKESTISNWAMEYSHMSDCLHCDIHELLESQLQGKETNLEEIVAKVTEVLADLILLAPPDQQSTLMADVLANLGSFLLEKKEAADPTNPRRSSH
jgi:hypothetical protein